MIFGNEPLDGHWTTHTQSADFVPTSNNSITGAKLLNGVENSKGLPILNCSKVVDENGEPKVVFKRMPEAVNEFNTEFGQFFSSEPIEDLSFGDYVGEYFLNIREPLQLDAKGTSWSYPLWLMLADENDEMPRSDEEYNEIIEKRNLLEFAPKEIWDIVREDSEELDFEDAINIIKTYNLPYNGAIVRNIGEGGDANQIMDDYIVMQPTQIKSATDNVGTFDGSNPDVRYSVSEQVESVLEDYTLNKDNVVDFEYALMESIAGQSYSARPDYKVLDGVEIRVKGHTPDWDNFVDWETDKVESEKILNVGIFSKYLTNCFAVR